MTRARTPTSTKVLLQNHLNLPRRLTPSSDILQCTSSASLHGVTLQAEATASIQSYFISLCTTDIIPLTATKYRHCLKRYASWLQDRSISEQTAKEFLLSLREQGFSNSTIKFYYHTLKPFLAAQGFTLRLKFKRRTKLPTYHSVDQVKAILNAAENRSGKWSLLADRDYLIIALFAYTGMRRGELLALRPRDIDLFNNTILIHGKGDKERIIPIHLLLLEPLKRYIVDILPHHFIFPFKAKRCWQIVSNYARIAGIPNFHPHCFRHFFATQLIEKGVALHIIKELLGHADISTTAVYLDVLPKHLDTAVQVLPDFNK